MYCISVEREILEQSDMTVIDFVVELIEIIQRRHEAPTDISADWQRAAFSMR